MYHFLLENKKRDYFLFLLISQGAPRGPQDTSQDTLWDTPHFITKSFQ